MDDQTKAPRVLSESTLPAWTKFGERFGKSDGQNRGSSYQTTLQRYLDRGDTHGAANEFIRKEQDASRPGHSPAQGSTLAVLLPSSTSPRKASNLVTEPEGSLANPMSLPNRIKKGIFASQPSGPASAQSSATPPPSSTSTPTSTGRGRPKGWKPGMSYAAMRGNTPPRWKTVRPPRQPRAKAPQPGFGRRPGRPPRARSPPPKELYLKSNPHFISFLCEWTGCKAELHNLDTLRKHLHIVHEQSGKWSCKWGQCKLDSCTDSQQWRSHLENNHLIPFRWHAGDGPSNTSGKHTKLPDDSRDIPSFLLGSDGQQVTPSIKDQRIEDFATWRENRRKLKDILIQRDKNLPDESSEVSEGED